MMDEKQIESLKRRYGSRIADAPKRRRGPERMAVMKGGKPKAGGQTMLRLLSYLKRDRMAMTVAFFCVILGTVTNLAGAYMLRPIINRYIVPLDGSRGDVAGLFRSLCKGGDSKAAHEDKGGGKSGQNSCDFILHVLRPPVLHSLRLRRCLRQSCPEYRRRTA